VEFAVSAAGLGEVAAGRAGLRRAGAVLHGRVVLIAVTAGGVGLAFAAFSLARGAETLSGVGKGKRYE